MYLYYNYIKYKAIYLKRGSPFIKALNYQLAVFITKTMYHMRILNEQALDLKN